ncbi:hypothetical protein, partial [Limnoraphis robusta]
RENEDQSEGVNLLYGNFRSMNNLLMLRPRLFKKLEAHVRKRSYAVGSSLCYEGVISFGA